ncbi:MAG: hypothetical protein QNL62_24535 [Gammaproteobacteria bacterium]|nr:hypothetical protein [Gammaproteobacteria bacterium]
MEHYSIQAVDIFISEIAPKRGWHQGHAVHYIVNNCAWESRVELQTKANQQAYFELQATQIFQSGDQEKMLKDQMITQIALQAHIYRHWQDNRAISWV